MKKIMLGILVVIPLIVVITVGLVTNFVSVRAYISVESVDIANGDIELEITHSADDYYSVDDLVGIMGVTVLPAHATNPAVEMTISGITPLDSEITDADGDGKDDVTGEYYVEFLKSDKASHTDIIGTGDGDEGYLKVTAYCAFDITVTAEGSVSARCSVRVTGALSAISIAGASTVEVGESMLLTPVFTPIDAVVRSAVWSSNAEGVAVVDPNGVVTGISEGSAEISVSVTREDGETVEAAVIVEVVRGATVFGSEVYTHLRTVSLDSLGLDGASVTPISNCTVAGGSIVIDASATEASFRVGGEPVTLYVCDEDELIVKGSEYFAADGYVLERDGMPLWLTVDWKSDLRSDPAPAVVSWVSGAEAVASVSPDGYVRGLASGTVTITANTANGGAVSIDLTVARKVAVLQLEDTETSMQLGLARQTVVASGRYDGSGIVDNAYSVAVRYPVADEGESAEEFYSSFLFTLSVEGMDDASAYLTFDGNTVVFDYDRIKADGVFSERTKVTVTVSARYPKYDDPALEKYSTASFFFYVVDGVRVTTYSELSKALGSGTDAVLADSIAVEGNGSITSTASLYGNGYSIYTTQLGQLGSASNQSVAIITLNASNIVISNVTMRANPVPEDGIIKAETYQQGYCLRFNQANWENELVEYCILENARTALSATGGKITVTGCIIRNTSGGGLHVRCPANAFTDLTLRNCVMTNCLSPSNFQYQNGYNGTDAGGTPSVPEGAPTKTTLTIEGFFDAYCWFDISQGSFIPDETLEDALNSVGGSGATVDFIQGQLRNIVLETEYLEPFRYHYNNGVYVHVAFMSSGLTVRSYLSEGNNFTTEDDRFHIINTDDFEDALLDLIGTFAKYPLYLWSYDNTVTDITPASVCVVNSRLIDRLHSEV